MPAAQRHSSSIFKSFAYENLAGCSRSPGDAITRVLNTCAETPRKVAVYNNNPGLQARFVAEEAQKIDIRDCPADFRGAFQAHIFAWQQSAAALQNNTAGAAVLETHFVVT